MTTTKPGEAFEIGQLVGTVRTPKLPPTFKVAVGSGRYISVVRRDIMDSALGRGAKK